MKLQGQQGQGLRIDAVLLFEHAGRKSVRCVTGENRDFGPQDGGTGIEIGSHEMHGAAVDLRAVGQCPLMSVEALIGGEQRGMDVEHPALPALDEGRCQNAHEAGAGDDVDVL